MTEDNEIREPRLDLTQAVRDTLGRAGLDVTYQKLKAAGQMSWSAKVKPAPAADVALIAAAYKNNESHEMRLDLKQEVRDKLGRAVQDSRFSTDMFGRGVQDSRFSTDKLKASGETPADESAEVQPAAASDRALIAAAYIYLHESGQLPIAEHNEVYVSRPELMGAVRDAIAKSTLDESQKSLKAAGQQSVRAKPVCAADRFLIAAAYNNAVVLGSMPAADPDRALIADAYRYLQDSAQLPIDQPEVVVCVHSSDEVHDFFAEHGLGACEDAVCKFLGIEGASDLKLVTAEDINGSQFSMWARGSLTIVQQKKLLKAFS